MRLGLVDLLSGRGGSALAACVFLTSANCQQKPAWYRVCARVTTWQRSGAEVGSSWRAALEINPSIDRTHQSHLTCGARVLPPIQDFLLQIGHLLTQLVRHEN